MKQLISLSPVGPETFENLQESRELDGFGISRKWLAAAKTEWEQYDWLVRARVSLCRVRN